MATKNNPGKFDCYGAADPDEPLFVLRANDELAPSLVTLWALIRSRAPLEEMQNVLIEACQLSDKKSAMKHEKYQEAMQCAIDMVDWRVEHAKR